MLTTRAGSIPHVTDSTEVEAAGGLPVFISWSLSLSEEVAKALRNWLPGIVPGVDPWFSGEDIETGKFWQPELNKSLERSTVGVVVVTSANANRPWLNFEAGRLSSRIESHGGVVMPLLIDLDLSDAIGGPITTLNAVTFGEEGIWRIVKAIHDRSGTNLTEAMLRQLFELNWPALSSQVGDVTANDHASASDSAKPAKRQTADVLEELVYALAELRQDVARIDSRRDESSQRYPAELGSASLHVRDLVAGLIGAAKATEYFARNIKEERERYEVAKVMKRVLDNFRIVVNSRGINRQIVLGRLEELEQVVNELAGHHGLGSYELQ